MERIRRQLPWPKDRGVGQISQEWSLSARSSFIMSSVDAAGTWKLITLSIPQNLQVIKRCRCHVSIMQEHNINSPAISHISMQKTRLHSYEVRRSALKWTHWNTLVQPYKWFTARRFQVISVPGPRSRRKLCYAVMEMSGNCTLLHGWLYSCNAYDGIRMVDNSGEGRPADSEVTQRYNEQYNVSGGQPTFKANAKLYIDVLYNEKGSNFFILLCISPCSVSLHG